MAGWVDNLRVAKHSIEELAKFRAAPVASAMTSNVQATLFRDLIQIHHMKSGTQILFNVQLAALHLSFMLKSPRTKLVRHLFAFTGLYVY